jgi:hypothetical protein
MSDPTTLALLKFLGLDHASTRRVVLVLDAEKLPRMTVTSMVQRIRPDSALGVELAERTRSFDLVPTDDRRHAREEMEAIRLDLSVGDGEDAIKRAAEEMAEIRPFPKA